MATRFRVTLPNGTRKDVYYKPETDRNELVEDLLIDKWEDYCLQNWPAKGSEFYSPSGRVSNFLDACATIILKGNAKDTVSHYKDIMHGKTEIPVSSCPSGFDHLINGGRITRDDTTESQSEQFSVILDKLDERAKPYRSKKSKRQKKEFPITRFKRIEEIKNKIGPCNFVFCRVDTDGGFNFLGKKYLISQDLPEYKPSDVNGESFYSMDRIIVAVRSGFAIAYYNQSLKEIPDAYIAAA